MTANNRPRIILVHGAWVGSWEFDPLVQILRERGWEVDALDLPSTGSTESMIQDAAAITAAIDRAGGPVVLVGHSYGGVPVTEAGDHPAVERIVYVAAFALDAGESVITSMGGSLPGVWGISDAQLTMGRSRDERVDMIAADMPPGVPREASEQLADLFRPQSLASFSDAGLARRVAGEARDLHPHRERRRRLARFPGVARRAQRRRDRPHPARSRTVPGGPRRLRGPARARRDPRRPVAS